MSASRPVSTANLSGELTLKDRGQIVRDYLQSYQVRSGGKIAIGEGTDPWLRAQVIADVLAPVYGDTQVIADGTSSLTSRGKRLEALLTGRGLQGRLPASGSSGFVEIVASTAGTTIEEGDELTDPSGTIRFKCAQSAAYLNEAGVPIVAISTGPVTNLPAGTVLRWVSPRPGCGPEATVKVSAGGKGLVGGREAETDDAMARRFKEAVSNPAASGNDAAYQLAVQATPGVPVDKCFTYPAVKGAGTTCIVFTVRPERPGGLRRPTPIQIAQVEGALLELFPHDDGIFFATLLQQPVPIKLATDWVDQATAWIDLIPWPQAAQNIQVSAVTSATAFSVSGTGTAPTAGKSIALYDVITGTFSRKRILTVTGSGPWALTIDTTNDASDASYTPTVGQLVCPWSDSLDLLAPEVAFYFEAVGPGEQVAVPYDEGYRQKRSPPPAPSWPNTVKNKLVDPVQDLAAVSDAALLSPAIPYTTTVGVPGVTAYLLELSDLVAFPLS